MKKLVLLSLLFVSPAFADMEKAYKAEQAKDFKTAYEEFTLEAETGNTEAMVMLGVYYAQGIHVTKDQNKSNGWMLKAAELGDATGELNMGIGYKIGLGDLRKDDISAFKWFSAAAEKGHPQAQYETGASYHYGVGVARNLEKARLWYLKAGEQNHPAAQNNLASIFGKGQGVPADPNLAREWLEKAASNNHLEALFTLGLIYHQAMDVEQDYNKASGYFRRAFIEGKAEAASFLAEYHYLGFGVGKSPVNAMMWLMLGTEISSTVAGGQINQETLERLQQNRSVLENELSKADFSRAVALKDDFIKEHLEQ